MADCSMCYLQQSLLTVLKESFKVYKAISEGLINLADRYFEMEYHDAHKGLEIYKESIAANDRLQQYYQQIEQIEELRRAIQFPKLESPPADFLTQMEAYAREAPRPYDESTGAAGSKKVTMLRCAAPALSYDMINALCCAVLGRAMFCYALLAVAVPLACMARLCCAMLCYVCIGPSKSLQWFALINHCHTQLFLALLYFLLSPHAPALLQSVAALRPC